MGMVAKGGNDVCVTDEDKQREGKGFRIYRGREEKGYCVCLAGDGE